MSPIAIPSTSQELEELLHDDTRLNQLLAENQWPDFVRAYTRNQLEARGGELARQTLAAQQTGIQDYARTLADSAPTGDGGEDGEYRGRDRAREIIRAEAAEMRGANSRISLRAAARRQRLYNKRALGSALNGHAAAASFGTLIRNVLATKKQAGATAVEEFSATFEGALRNAMGERVPSEGGFLVPEVLRSDLLMLALENAIVRPRARVIPMDSLRVPYPTVDDPSHQSSVFGGVVGFWTEEAGALEDSQPAFGRVVLDAKKLTAYTEIPNELLQDSGQALDQFFDDMYPEAIAWFEDLAFMLGSGVGQPLGMYNATCAVSVARALAGAIQFSDIAAMYSRMLPQSLNRAVWLCPPDGIQQLLTMSNIVTVGETSTPIAPPLWLQAMSAAEGVQYSILGRPLIVTEKAPALGDVGDLAFIDWGYYLLGDRQVMHVANSDQYKFQNDLTAFRVIERVDGRPWLRSALTPANGSENTLSPVVKLGDAA